VTILSSRLGAGDESARSHLANDRKKDHVVADRKYRLVRSTRSLQSPASTLPWAPRQCRPQLIPRTNRGILQVRAALSTRLSA